MNFEEFDNMQMIADIAEDLYKRRKLKEQWDMDMAQRWERMITNASSEAPTFHHPDEIVPPNGGHPYIPLDALKRTKLSKPSGRGRSFVEEQSTQIRNPSFSVTAQDKKREREREAIELVNNAGPQLDKLKTVVEVALGPIQREKLRRRLMETGDRLDALRKQQNQHATGDSAESWVDLPQALNDFIEAAKALDDFDNGKRGTIIAGTACAKQCQEDILNAANGEPEKSHGQIRCKPRGKPIPEGRLF